MSGVILSQRQRPDDVAAMLDAWALRRESTDLDASLLARRVAGTCRVLAAAQDAELDGGSWNAAWQAARTEAQALLARPEVWRRSSAPPAADSESERITLSDGTTLADEDDRMTPILPPAPQPFDEDERVA